MEYDRYKGHHKMYIISIISLVVCLSFLLFSLYILPFLIWGGFDVPEFVIALLTFFQDKYGYSTSGSGLMTWLVFFMPSLILGFVSYYTANTIDDELLGVKPEMDEKVTADELRVKRLKRQETLNLTFKILGLMFLIVLAIFLIQFIL